MNRKPALRSFGRQGPSLVLAAFLSLSFAFLAPPTDADIILLTNGKTLEGTLEELSNGKVRVRLAYGSLSFSKDQIATVHSAQTFDEIVDDALRSLSPQDAQGRYRLARQAREEQSLTLYRKLLREDVTIDPDHEAARRELGYVAHDGSWVTERQFHELRGEVRFRGEWMSPQTRDQILVAEAEDRRASRERQQARIEAARQRQEAAAAAQLEAEVMAAARSSAYSSVLRPGCNSGFSSRPFAYGGFYGGYGSGPAYQALQPFQPGLIQVPNQTFRYSLHQVFRARPGRISRPHVGYRADPPPRRRR